MGWTAEDKDVLAEFRDGAIEAASRNLPAHTRESIVIEACKEGYRDRVKTHWTDEELVALRTFYPRYGPTWRGWEDILPRRTYKAIQGMASAYGIKVDSNRWTDREDSLIRLNYPAHGFRWSAWSELLPGRTQQAIRSRASVLGVCVVPAAGAYSTGKRWTADEIDVICKNYPNHGPAWKGWSELLPGRSPKSIERKAHGMGLKVTKEAQ